MSNIKCQKLTRCKPSKCKPKPFHHNQGSSIPSLKHPKWIKKKQVAQLYLTPHLVATSWLSLVCLFIPCFYVSLNSKNPCSIWCTLFMYIYIYFFKKFKKNSRFPNLSQKKEKNFQKKKNLWTRDIGLPSDFFKKCPFFFFQRFQDSLKSSFQNGTWGSLGQNFF